ncbi:MAG TPA: hypothetical protein VN241_00480 [Microbacterium sp.]|nr:hypothetical protein [Microbacterium sp.]
MNVISSPQNQVASAPLGAPHCASLRVLPTGIAFEGTVVTIAVPTLELARAAS